MTRLPTPRHLLALGAALVVAGSVAVTAPVLVGAAEPDTPGSEGTGTGVAGQMLTVTPVDDLDPAGETVTVTGEGFEADAGFDTATDGLSIALCVARREDVAPGPCVGGLDLSGETDASRWITNDPDPGTPSVAIGADGSFTTTITVRQADEHVDCAALPAGEESAVVVRRDHRAGGDRTQDVEVPVTFGAGGSAPTEPAGPTTTTDPAPGIDPGEGDGAGTAVPSTTTTALIVAPTTIAAGEAVTATASVGTADADTGARSGRAAVTEGTVELFDGSTSLGTAPLGPDGRATRTATFATAGAHSVTARFTGTDDATASTSDPVVVTVTAAVDPDPDPDPDPDVTPSGTRTGTGAEGQTLTATPVDNLDPAGTEVEVVGAGFTEAAGFDIDEGGLYVSFCVDNGAGAQPSPCVGGVDMEGASGSSKWVTNNPYTGVPPEAVSPIADDGSFTARITVSARDEFVDCLDLPAGQRCVIVSRVDHRATADRSQDVKVPVCFAGEAACATDPIDPTPQGGTTPPPFGGYPLPQSGPGGTGSTPLATPGGLAATGFAGRTLVPVGIVLLGAGAALVLVARRRAVVPTP